MSSPRVVVIPFGVPASADSKGLGLGLAALVHSFTQLEGQSIALAQLSQAHPATLTGQGSGQEPAANFAEVPTSVEAFVPPQAWRDLASRDHAPTGVELVLTGAFEPPRDGKGALELLVYDGRDGSTRARGEWMIDEARAGESILFAFGELWSRVGGELGVMKDLHDLGWEALESVLRAERCALHDPARGGPHDRMAALAHLGRAVGDAPSARFPAGRLAAMALDAAASAGEGSRLAEAALRTLSRAADDAPEQIDVLEAAAALELRAGRPAEAEVRARSAMILAPERVRLYALLSEALRAQGELSRARDVVDEGLERAPDDPLLLTEQGVLAASAGDPVAASAAWRRVLAKDPGQPSSFVNLAAWALANQDVATAQMLIDQALALRDAHPDVLRRAIQLAHATESEGVARAARLVRLTRSLMKRSPDDAGALFVLARSLKATGETASAIEALTRVETLAADRPLAAEAQRLRFALDHPREVQEMEALLRAAYSASEADLSSIATRARRFAELHDEWPAWMAAGIAERRAQNWDAASRAFAGALKRAPGCVAAQMELVAVHVAQGDPSRALSHAEAAFALEGANGRTWALRATALHAAGRTADAQIAIDRALVMDETDEANRALAERIREAAAREGMGTRGRRTSTPLLSARSAWQRLFSWTKGKRNKADNLGRTGRDVADET